VTGDGRPEPNAERTLKRLSFPKLIRHTLMPMTLLAALAVGAGIGGCEPADAVDCKDRGFDWSDDDPPINRRHVFCGEINDGKPMGFHSTRLQATSQVVTGVRELSQARNGIADATVAFTNGATKFSTLFPDACTVDQVLASIHYASTRATRPHPVWGKLGPSAPAPAAEGYCLDGGGQPFEIRLGFLRDGRINTAFPNR
jgi:hypothetical protein